MPNPVTTTRLMWSPRAVRRLPSAEHSSWTESRPWRPFRFAPGSVPPRGFPIGSASEDMREVSALCVLFEEFHGITDRENRLGGIVRNLAAELFLEGHHQFDGVEAIGAEVVDETCSFGHLVGFDAEMFHDNLLHSLGNVTHRFHPRVFLIGHRRATRAVAASSWQKAACKPSASGGFVWSPPIVPSCPNQAGFGYHTSPALASAPSPHPPRWLSA